MQARDAGETDGHTADEPADDWLADGTGPDLRPADRTDRRAPPTDLRTHDEPDDPPSLSVDPNSGEPNDSAGHLDAGRCDDSTTPNPNLGLVEQSYSPDCPEGMVPIDGAFCIHRYEAHLEAWTPFAPPPVTVPPARAAENATPQGYISGRQAEAACEAAGKRLCTLEEWERACQGSSIWTYPYGETREWGWCNDHRDEHPAVEFFGTSAAWIWSELGHPCINQLPDSLARGGHFDRCETADGVFDMMGNLHEWIDDASGVMRGGFYVDTVINGEGCLYRTTAHSVDYSDYSTGFRCCAPLIESGG